MIGFNKYLEILYENKNLKIIDDTINGLKKEKNFN